VKIDKSLACLNKLYMKPNEYAWLIRGKWIYLIFSHY